MMIVTYTSKHLEDYYMPRTCLVTIHYNVISMNVVHTILGTFREWVRVFRAERAFYECISHNDLLAAITYIER